MNKAIKILIVDDYAVVRQGLSALIDTVADMVVIGEAGDGATAVQKALELHPDVIVMDLAMPGVDGIAAIEAIKQSYPLTRILVLTNFVEEERVLAALRSGAQGYLLKDAGLTDVIDAIRKVYDGRLTLHPGISDILIKALQNQDKKKETSLNPLPLTEREQTVLRLIAKGLTNQNIADYLFIDERTVRVHVSHILQKLNLENRTQAALYALRHQLASLDD